MALPTTPMYVSKLAQLGILEFNKSCYGMLLQNWNLREQMRAVDLSYIREEDLTNANTRAKLANSYGDSDKIQNVTIPVVMPQVENAVAYQSSVFLTGLPIFESVANPQFEDQALQFNTILEDQSVKGGWVREFQMMFRDGFKYNLFGVEVNWDSVVTAALETDLNYSTKEAKPTSIVWEGNVIKRRDPYNLIMDTRVSPSQISAKGEFAGFTEVMSRIALKDFINKLPLKIIDNIIPAFESGLSASSNAAPESYYVPSINPNSYLDNTISGDTDWLAWASLANKSQTINYKNRYEVTTLYGRIIPSDFGLKVPAANTPQVWKFIIVNQSVLIYAERQTNAHNLLPMLFGQPYEDGLSYQTKSLAQNVIPFQQVSSALMNQSLAASRKAIFDRMVYDPSRIREADINNPNPAAKIPTKPAAYGKPVGESFAPIPFRDDQSGQVMQKIAQLSQFTDEVSGRNRAQRGLFTKGNRTAEEYQDVMANANGRDMMVSMLLEAQVFTPLKEILKINILQYQGGTTLYSANQKREVTIDPVALRSAVLNFKVADGLTPISKQIDTDMLQVALQTLQSVPTLAAGYNVTPMFSYLMKTKGAEITSFEKSPQQVAYEQAMGAWQQAMAVIAEGLSKGKINVDDVQRLMPPQPTPEQFQYAPGSPSQLQAKQQPTIMQQVISMTTPQGATQNGAAMS